MKCIFADFTTFNMQDKLYMCLYISTILIRLNYATFSISEQYFTDYKLLPKCDDDVMRSLTAPCWTLLPVAGLTSLPTPLLQATKPSVREALPFTGTTSLVGSHFLQLFPMYYHKASMHSRDHVLVVCKYMISININYYTF